MSDMGVAIAGRPAGVRVLRGVQVIRTLAELDRLASAWERLAAEGNPVTDFAYARAWAAGFADSHDQREVRQTALPAGRPPGPLTSTSKPAESRLSASYARPRVQGDPRGPGGPPHRKPRLAAPQEGNQRLSVLTAGGRETLAIAPLTIHGGWAGWLTLLAAEMYEVMDFPGADESAVAELAHGIVRTGRPLDLKRIPADAPAIAALEAAYRGRGIVRRRAVGGSPWIPLDDSWVAPEMRLEAGRRSDLRRARRHAEKMGAVEAAVITPARDQLPQLLDETFQVEAAGWKGARGTALANDPVRGAFFRRYTEQACAKGTLRMCVLRIGGQPAAAQIAIESGSRFDLLRAGYDERFARCSPGMLLTAESIRYAARRGLRSYEFNGDAEPWTKIWTRHEHACCSLRAYPFSPRGVWALAADGGQAAVRELLRFRPGFEA
jgi:CelD/BcsL family acetyltransferase involved in cellulose biosynthesis